MVIDISELWDGGPNVGDFPIEKKYYVFNIVKMLVAILLNKHKVEIILEQR